MEASSSSPYDGQEEERRAAAAAASARKTKTGKDDDAIATRKQTARGAPVIKATKPPEIISSSQLLSQNDKPACDVFRKHSTFSLQY